jgi:hypothetical protein
LTATHQPKRSAAPGIIPEPAELQDGVPTAATERPRSKPGGHNPIRLVAGRMMSALRGDKYMVDAYPPAGSESSAAPGDAESRAQER